jgi:hypothetical protein
VILSLAEDFRANLAESVLHFKFAGRLPKEKAHENAVSWAYDLAWIVPRRPTNRPEVGANDIRPVKGF